MTIVLFPDQLFREAITGHSEIILVEHPLFFRQLPFHKQKLILHHVSMRCFQDEAVAKGRSCEIISLEQLEQRPLIDHLRAKNYTDIAFYEPRDDYLSREIRAISQNIQVSLQATPCFLTPLAEWNTWHGNRASLRMADFYQWQRKRLGILMDGHYPTGGKWSFDTENRRRLPKSVFAPRPYSTTYSERERGYIAEAKARFIAQPGSDSFTYPVSHEQAEHSLMYFVQTKLAQFGDYEDAVSSKDPVLFHSQLTPSLNCGLLTPKQVLTAVLSHAEENTVPLNSLEGFIRQLIGWREFMSLTYLTHGRKMRTSNSLKHHNPLPAVFWKGETGLIPIDHIVKQVLATGYAHHIERLMILGVFMLLTETEPTECFDWFFAMFIDAYDWVMVPNVYAMSQYADGGLLTTKPYVCGSAYLRNMTDFPRGEWCDIWDGLYWRWVSRHQPLLLVNPRTSMSVNMWKSFSSDKQGQLVAAAENFLKAYYA